MCEFEGGHFEENIETTATGFFSKDEIPDNMAVEKCSKEQVLMCFEAYENPNLPAMFE